MQEDENRQNTIQQQMQQNLWQQFDRVEELAKHLCQQLRQQKEQARTCQQERDALLKELAGEREAKHHLHDFTFFWQQNSC